MDQSGAKHFLSIVENPQISEILHLLVEKWMKNSPLLHDLEKIMIYLGDLTQDCNPKRMLILSSAPLFLRSILSLVTSWVSVEDKLSEDANQFHQCCHLGVFVLLGLINGRVLCESFLRVRVTISTILMSLISQTVDESNLFQMIAILPRLLLNEIQYSTQEMILEIFCRYGEP
jgi:hypothetical protein